jgi:8-oxo-dGTP diphosphatase
MKHTVLVFVFRDSVHTGTRQLLMIEKKRGQGKGYWNVPGGKIKEGEDTLEGARRECEEETGLRPGALEPRGRLNFRFVSQGTRAPDSWDNFCDLFVSFEFEGELVSENDECRAEWVDVEKIPFDQMWESDRSWFGRVVKGLGVYRNYVFDEFNHLVSEEIDPRES